MNKNELKNILEKHKKWLAGNPDGERADLRGANLRDADLRDVNLHNADLRGADLHGSDLRGADLHGSDLSMADLSMADLRMANLCEADLDYSTWPLWCGSFNVKVDKGIAAQLAYHFCRLDCDDPEYQEAREALSKLANQFHRVDECGRIEDHV